MNISKNSLEKKTQTGIKDYWQLKDKISKDKWLILGKGPSLNQFDSRDFTEYNILALNHVGRYVDSDMCIYHDNDVEHVTIIKRCTYVLKPYHPHVNFKPYPLVNVPWWNNVYYFNLSTWKGRPNSDSPIIRAKYNVAESAFHILALFGVREIRTLGVDGGHKYAKFFEKEGYVPLTNGQPDFNKQFIEIKRICKKFNIKYSPM